MSDDIERPSFTTWCLACLGTEAGACLWFLGAQKVNRPPLWQIIGVMFTVALLYVGVYQWRCWKWRTARQKKIAAEEAKLAKVNEELRLRAEEHERERQARALEGKKAKEAEREAFLSERIQCKGGCSDAWQPRRSFYQIEVWGGPDSVTPPYVCAQCWKRIKGADPHGNPNTKPAF
jgi:hypothetical protein